MRSVSCVLIIRQVNSLIRGKRASAGKRERAAAVRGLVRLSIQEPLALRVGEQGGRPFPIGHVSGVGAEIELFQVEVQMRLADVVERAENARFNNAKWISTVLV